MPKNPAHDTAWREEERDHQQDRLELHQKQGQEAIYGTESEIRRLNSKTEIRRMKAIDRQVAALDATQVVDAGKWSGDVVEPKPFARGTITDFKGGRLVVGRVLGEGLTGMVTQGVLAHGAVDAPVIVKFAKAGYEDQLYHEREVLQGARVDKIKGGAPLLAVDQIDNPQDGSSATVGIARFVPGQTLDRTLVQEERYPNQVVGSLAGIARTIQDAHRQGVAHLDIKPSNTLIDQDGRPTTVDWGLTRPIGSRENAVRGTLHYMAPEVARGDYTVSGKEDVYAVAMIGARAANGRYHRSYLEDPRIHDKDRISELFDRISSDRSLPQVKDKLLGTILARAAQPDPAQRSSSLDLMTDLAAYPEARAQYDKQDRELVVGHLTKRFGATRGTPAQNVDLDATVARGLLEDLDPRHPQRRILADIASSSKGYVIDRINRPATALAEQPTVDGVDLLDNEALPIFSNPGVRR
jgi:serine/threonine protein kinase